jgi:hypothetical protein
MGGGLPASARALAAVGLLVGCSRPRAGDGTPSPAPAPPPSAPASAAPAAPASAARPAPVARCAAPFVVAPAHPDTWVDDAAASPPGDVGAWSTRPMSGPFATRDLARSGCTDVRRVAAAPPFDEIVTCTTGQVLRPLGPDNIAAHLLLVRTARGYWSHEIVREHWPHRPAPGDVPRVARVTEIVAADRLGDGGAELTILAADGPPGGDQTRRVFVCGLGPSGVPACADVRVAAGGPFHGPGALLYRLTLGCDGTLAVAGWEGGTPVKLVHGRGTLAFP